MRAEAFATAFWSSSRRARRPASRSCPTALRSVRFSRQPRHRRSVRSSHQIVTSPTTAFRRLRPPASSRKTYSPRRHAWFPFNGNLLLAVVQPVLVSFRRSRTMSTRACEGGTTSGGTPSSARPSSAERRHSPPRRKSPAGGGTGQRLRALVPPPLQSAPGTEGTLRDKGSRALQGLPRRLQDGSAHPSGCRAQNISSKPFHPKAADQGEQGAAHHQIRG